MMINDPSDVLSRVPMVPSARAEVESLRRRLVEQTQINQAQKMEIRYWRDECARLACERDVLRMTVSAGRMAP